MTNSACTVNCSVRARPTSSPGFGSFVVTLTTEPLSTRPSHGAISPDRLSTARLIRLPRSDPWWWLEPSSVTETRRRTSPETSETSTSSLDFNAAVMVEQTGAEQTVRLEAGGKADLTLPLIGGEVGAGTVTVALSDGSGQNWEQSLDIPIRPATLAGGGQK